MSGLKNIDVACNQGLRKCDGKIIGDQLRYIYAPKLNWLGDGGADVENKSGH